MKQGFDWVQCIKSRDIQKVKSFIEQRADVNVTIRYEVDTDDVSNIPLHIHVLEESEEEIRALLLDSKSYIKNKCGMTPLHFAAHYNAIDVAALLVKNGAIVNAKSVYGDQKNRRTFDADNTPLHIAALKRHQEIAKLLIDNNADVNAKNGYGETPLHFAACDNAIEVAKLLVDSNANLEAQSGPQKNHRKATPLHVAVRCNAIEVAKLLVRMCPATYSFGLCYNVWEYRDDKVADRKWSQSESTACSRRCCYVFG